MDITINQNKILLVIFSRLNKVIPIKHIVSIAFIDDNRCIRFAWQFKLNKNPYTITESMTIEELHTTNDNVDLIDGICHRAFLQFQHIKNSI
jgi:hypothetical protein